MTNTEDSSATSVRFSLLHSIDVATAAAQAYRLINAIEEWPGLFPPCKAARVIQSDGDEVLVEITAQVGAVVRTWRSQRTRVASRFQVLFQQVDPFPPVAGMSGHWRVHPTDAQHCRVELFHSFEVSADSAARATPSRTLGEAEEWVRSICDVNSESELEAFKTACEGRVEVGAPRALEEQA